MNPDLAASAVPTAASATWCACWRALGHAGRDGIESEWITMALVAMSEEAVRPAHGSVWPRRPEGRS